MWKGLLSDIINNKLEKWACAEPWTCSFNRKVPFLGKPHSSRGSGKGAYFESYILSYRKGDVWFKFEQNKTIRSNISTSTRDESINPSTRIWHTWRHFDFSGTEVFSFRPLNHCLQSKYAEKKINLTFSFWRVKVRMMLTFAFSRHQYFEPDLAPKS